MKIAIRLNDIFREVDWQDKFIENEMLLTQEPYNYTIVEVNENIDFELLKYSHFISNVFNMSLYNADVNNEINKIRMTEITTRLKEIDIKRFKFIDSELTSEDYEVFRLEAIDLRLEYNDIE